MGKLLTLPEDEFLPSTGASELGQFLLFKRWEKHIDVVGEVGPLLQENACVTLFWSYFIFGNARNSPSFGYQYSHLWFTKALTLDVGTPQVELGIYLLSLGVFERYTERS